MKKNASLRQLGEYLAEAERIVIFPHVNPDGDALGSAVALCLALQKIGKQCRVLLEEEVPAYIGFLNAACCTQDRSCIGQPDVCICVDCSEESRFPNRIEAFHAGKLQLCIDHHLTGAPLGDYYYIDPEEAATAQIIYKLLVEMDWAIDAEIAEALYTGIVTDTGSFQYSNTTAESHQIAGALLQCGFDHMKVTIALYQNVSRRKLELQIKVLETMEVFADGRAAMAYVTEKMLQDLDASMDDAEGIVDLLRNIDGVEIAAFLKEREEGIKVSLRAKSYGNVDQIAGKFGGGGHAKAAGCTIKEPMENAVARLKQEIEEYWSIA